MTHTILALSNGNDLTHAKACLESALTHINQALEVQPTPPAAPVAWNWHQAPVKTSWGHDMVVADLAIDEDHTVSVYCEHDQIAKVEAMFTTPPAQPAPVQEPESFEKWNAKQHGDPGEIGLLQALRIAYYAGQDSVTKGTPPAQPAAQPEPVALRTALAEALGCVYVCNRTWSAWGVGTMTQDDFYPVAESDDMLDSLVEAVAKSTPPAAAVTLTDEQILDLAENCTAQYHDLLSFARAVLAATPPTAVQEIDPCHGCQKGGVCKTPECGRLELPREHLYRTGLPAQPAPVQQEPVQQEPVAWEVGSHLVVRSDMCERLNYKGPWVDMDRAIPDGWVPVLYITPPAPAKPANKEHT
jgi:hypothetical protein